MKETAAQRKAKAKAKAARVARNNKAAKAKKAKLAAKAKKAKAAKAKKAKTAKAKTAKKVVKTVSKSVGKRCLKGLAGATKKTPIALWVMFCYNYPNDFIDKVFKGSPIIDHLRSKFNSRYEKYGASLAMQEFWIALDQGNRKKLETWILKNYKG